jgi:hypothetical protein
MVRKLIIISGFILSIMFLFSVPLHSTDWDFVAMTKKYYYYIDSDSIITLDTEIIFRVIKMDMESWKLKASKKCVIDCSYEMANILEDIRYDDNARIEEEISYHDVSWYDIRKGKATQEIAGLLCVNGGPRKDIKKYLKQPFQIKDNNLVSSINNLNSANLDFNSQ